MIATPSLTTRTLVMAVSAVVAGCSTPHSAVTLHHGSSDGQGYDFVIPRTVVKVAPAAADSKSVGSNNLTFTAVPVITDRSDQALPRFWVSDSSSSGSGFALTPTGITAASYADNLILSAIGTQITDNRSAAIDAGISVLGLVAGATGLGLAGAAPEKCTTPSSIPPFAIDKFDDVAGAFVPGSSNCWGYDIKVLHSESDLDPNARSIVASGKDAGGLPLEQKISWFPYPACRTVLIKVHSCDANNTNQCDGNPKENPTIQTLNVSSGEQYRRMLLPVKGKIAFHADFCGADVTDDSSGLQSNWSLLKQAINDYNNLKQGNKKGS